MSIGLFDYSKLNQLLATNSHRILALMLLFLHAFLIWGDQTSYLHHTFFLSHHDPLLFMHIVGHPENIVLVEGGVASLSPSELLRYSVDKDDVTGAGE